jgi:hypothetical protein
MTKATHAVTMNGSISFELKGNAGSSPEEEMLELLGRLNGAERYSIVVWAIPENLPFDRVDPRVFPTEYIQCAGGMDDRFICEVREGSADAAKQYALGRAEAEAEAGDGVVPWNGRSSTVPANEVLNAIEVEELFVEYFRSGRASASYAHRELDLNPRD